MYLPGSAKLRNGSSPITQPLWAKKWHILSGWSSSCISCSSVMSWYGKVKYLRQTDENTEIHQHSACHHTLHVSLSFTATVQKRKKLSWVTGMLHTSLRITLPVGMRFGMVKYFWVLCLCMWINTTVTYSVKKVMYNVPLRNKLGVIGFTLKPYEKDILLP